MPSPSLEALHTLEARCWEAGRCVSSAADQVLLAVAAHNLPELVRSLARVAERTRAAQQALEALADQARIDPDP